MFQTTTLYRFVWRTVLGWEDSALTVSTLWSVWRQGQRDGQPVELPGLPSKWGETKFLKPSVNLQQTQGTPRQRQAAGKHTDHMALRATIASHNRGLCMSENFPQDFSKPTGSLLEANLQQSMQRTILTVFPTILLNGTSMASLKYVVHVELSIGDPHNRAPHHRNCIPQPSNYPGHDRLPIPSHRSRWKHRGIRKPFPFWRLWSFSNFWFIVLFMVYTTQHFTTDLKLNVVNHGVPFIHLPASIRMTSQ